jgi:hypothetical protein
MVKLAVPWQVPINPRPMMVAMTGDVPLFAATKTGIFALLPLAPRPMVVLVLVHEKLTPVALLESVRGPTVAPAQTCKLAGVIKSGVGLIVMFLLTVVVPHSFVTLREKV